MLLCRLIILTISLLSLNLWSLNSSYQFAKTELLKLTYLQRHSCTKNIGNFFEHVTALLLEKKFPKGRYNIVKNIEYENIITKFRSEIDIAVFDNETNNAIQIYEVKCWHDRKKAVKKGQKQLKRFKYNVLCGLMSKKNTIRIFKDHTHFSALAFLTAELKVIVPKTNDSPEPTDEEIDLSLTDVQQLYHIVKDLHQAGKYSN